MASWVERLQQNPAYLNEKDPAKKARGLERARAQDETERQAAPPAAVPSVPSPVSGPAAPPVVGLPEPGSFQPTPGPSLPAVPLHEETMRQLAIPGAAIPTGMLGLLPDVANLLSSIGGMVPGSPQIPKIPLGSADLRALIGAPEPTNEVERLTQTLGNAMGPGGLLKLGKLVGLPRATVEAIAPWLTAGPRGDAAMGGASWLGSEMAPGLGVPKEIGALAGPLGVATGHRALSGALPKIGAGARGQQDIATAQTGLKQAQEATATALQPIAPTLETTVTPTAGTRLPTGQEAGQAAQLSARGLEARQTAQLERGVRDLQTTIAPRLERMETLDQLQQGYKQQFGLSKKFIGDLFDATEAITKADGTAPQVSLTNLHQSLGPMGREAAQTGQRMPSGAGAMARTAREDALTPAETAAISAGINPSLAGVERSDLVTLLQEPFFLRSLDPQQQQFVQGFLPQLQAGAPADVPFWLARRMESGLREQAYEGAKPIGSLAQGRARELYWAVSEDLRDFYKNTPEGQTIQPALRDAKDQYIGFVNLFNRTITKHMLNPEPGVRERFLKEFVKQPTEKMLTIRQGSDPETWNLAVSGVMEELMTNAMGGRDRFDPARLASVDKALQREGKIDVFFDATQKAQWQAIVQDASALKTHPGAKLAGQIRGRLGDEVAPFVFEPGKLGRTAEYKSTTDSATYDQVVKGWTGQFLAEARDLSDEALYKKLQPLARKDTSGVSQLDLIYEQYPQARDTIETAMRTYRQGQSDVTRAQLGLRDAKQRAGVEGSGIEEVRGYANLGKAHVRVGPLAAAVLSGVELARFGHPVWGAAVAGGMLTTLPAFRWWATHTTAGRRAIREGLPTGYAAPGARIGAGTEGPPPEEGVTP